MRYGITVQTVNGPMTFKNYADYQQFVRQQRILKFNRAMVITK